MLCMANKAILLWNAIANFQDIDNDVPIMLPFHCCWPNARGFRCDSYHNGWPGKSWAIQHRSYQFMVSCNITQKASEVQMGSRWFENFVKSLQASRTVFFWLEWSTLQNISSCIRKHWTVLKGKTDMKEIFLQISNRQDLSQDQVQAVFDRILKNEVSESQIRCLPYGAQN